MIDKQTQDQAWAALPKAFRDNIKEMYQATQLEGVQWIEDVERADRYAEAMEAIFGKHNLTSDAEPEEVAGNVASSNVASSDELKHRLEQTSVQVEESKAEPKFKVGDKVIHNHKNKEVGEVVEYYPNEKFCYLVRFGEEFHCMAEGQLLPYTEPTQTNDNMEEKELNLKEILKGHEGEMFFSPIIGDCKLRNMTKEYIYMTYLNNLSYCFHIDGRRENKGLCVLYPSREAYLKYPLDARAAGMEWQEEYKGSIALEVCLDMVDTKRIVTHHSAETFKFSSMEEAQQTAKSVKEFIKLLTQKNSQ